jgi:hypothetical protein
VWLKFPVWYCCKYLCTCTPQGRSRSYRAAVRFVQRCWHFWKHMWKSSLKISFSADVTSSWILSMSCKLRQGGYQCWIKPNVVISWWFMPAVGSLLPLIPWQGAVSRIQLCHWGGTNCWAKLHTLFYAQLNVTLSVFTHYKPGWLFGDVRTGFRSFL